MATGTMDIGTMGIAATATTVTAAIGHVTHIADGTNPLEPSFRSGARVKSMKTVSLVVFSTHHGIGGRN